VKGDRRGDPRRHEFAKGRSFPAARLGGPGYGTGRSRFLAEPFTKAELAASAGVSGLGLFDSSLRPERARAPIRGNLES
jgi:hypothetical protein